MSRLRLLALLLLVLAVLTDVIGINTQKGGDPGGWGIAAIILLLVGTVLYVVIRIIARRAVNRN